MLYTVDVTANKANQKIESWWSLIETTIHRISARGMLKDEGLFTRDFLAEALQPGLMAVTQVRQHRKSARCGICQLQFSAGRDMRWILVLVRAEAGTSDSPYIGLIWPCY